MCNNCNQNVKKLNTNKQIFKIARENAILPLHFTHRGQTNQTKKTPQTPHDRQKWGKNFLDPEQNKTSYPDTYTQPKKPFKKQREIKTSSYEKEMSKKENLLPS